MANSQSGPQSDVAGTERPVAEYETYPLRYKSGFAKMQTRVGDYAVTLEKGVRKGSAKSDGNGGRSRTQLSFTTSTTAGVVATTTVQRKASFTADYPREFSSLSEGILDSLLEQAWRVSICNDDPQYRKASSDIRATIGLTEKTAEVWQLDALALPVVDDFGSRSVWGRGTLTGGGRVLQLTCRSASPWIEEQCLQMRQAGDERKWECYRKVVDIDDDGELLAWFASHAETYTVCTGLEDDLKLVFLAAMEAFRKGNSGPY
jgi:hypothetical protein